MRRRNLLAAAAGGIAWLAPAGARAAEKGFPEHAVTIVVPFPPGGRVDLTARLLATRLQQAWSVPVLVINRVGAGGVIASRFVADAKADGYTLLFTSSAIVAAQYAVEKAPRAADFSPVAIVEVSHPLLLARKGLDFSLRNLAAARARAAPLSIGTVVGASGNVLTESFIARSGIDMTRVPFKGEAEAVAALAGGHVDLSSAGWAAVQGHVRGGTLDALAVAAASRVSEFANVPTFREFGMDLTLDVFSGLFAPPGTPQGVLAAIEETLVRCMADETLLRDMRQTGLNPQMFGSAGTRTFIARQDAQFREYAGR